MPLGLWRALLDGMWLLSLCSSFFNLHHPATHSQSAVGGFSSPKCSSLSTFPFNFRLEISVTSSKGVALGLKSRSNSPRSEVEGKGTDDGISNTPEVRK